MNQDSPIQSEKETPAIQPLLQESSESAKPKRKRAPRTTARRTRTAESKGREKNSRPRTGASKKAGATARRTAAKDGTAKTAAPRKRRTTARKKKNEGFLTVVKEGFALDATLKEPEGKLVFMPFYYLGQLFWFSLTAICIIFGSAVCGYFVTGDVWKGLSCVFAIFAQVFHLIGETFSEGIPTEAFKGFGPLLFHPDFWYGPYLAVLPPALYSWYQLRKKHTPFLTTFIRAQIQWVSIIFVVIFAAVWLFKLYASKANGGRKYSRV